MRVALIRPASSQVPGGSYNIQEIGLAKALAASGIESDIYLITDRDHEYTSEIHAGAVTIKVYRLKALSIPGRQAIFYSLFRILGQNHYDLIQVEEDSQITSVLVSIYGRRNNIPVILWQGMYENYRQIYKKAIQFFFDMSFLPILRSNVACAISKTEMAGNYLESKGFKNNHLGLVGLSEDSFAGETAGDEIDWYKRLDIPQGADIMLYIGQIEKRRNPDFLIRILEKLAVESGSLYLVVVGKGPLGAKFSGMMDKSPSKDRIRYPGPLKQKEVKGLYDIASCFLLPTDYEIFGMVILESMYHGVPVISTDVAGSAQLIEDGKDGYVLKGLDVESWCARVRELIGNRALRADMSKNASDKIKSKYLWPQVVHNYIRVYNDVLGKN